MTAEVKAGTDLFMVICADEECPRPLGLTVATRAHADNLAAKHNREHHPDPAPGTSVNLTAAARVLISRKRPGRGLAALGIFAALTALPEAEALAYAHQLVALRDAGQPDTIAHIPPL